MKRIIVVLIVVFFAFGILMISKGIKGDVVSDSEMGFEMDDEMGPEGFGEGEYGGPSDEDITCLTECIGRGCGPGDEACVNANSAKCEQECGVEPAPEPEGEGEACIQECILRGCDERDFSCQRMRISGCDVECGMVGEPEAQSEEEQCIRDCINAVDPSITCAGGTFEGEGETGNAVCQECAAECEHLYSGPCLTDELWTEKENVCYALCEHCYGESVMGPSGQGYECTVDIRCADASGEFGDDAGSGDDSFEDGHEGLGIIESVGEAVSDVVGNVFEGIGNFFKGLFGEDNSEEERTTDNNFDAIEK